jgi:hypothetical protein
VRLDVPSVSMRGPEWKPMAAARAMTRREAPDIYLVAIGNDVFALNASAALVWQQVDGQRTAPEVAASVAARVGVPVDQVASGVSRTLAAFVAGGLIG